MNGVHKRYALHPMISIWSEEQRLKRWIEVELAFLQARAEAGQLSLKAVELIREHAKVNIPRMDQIEKETRHDVIAFIKMVQESLRGTPAEPYAHEFHKLLTSYDTQDPATVIQLRQAVRAILTSLFHVIDAFRQKAVDHKWSFMIGLTHGQFAEPTTFGHLLLVFAAALQRSYERLVAVERRELSEGKISGAIGNYAGFEPALEVRALEILDLKPAVSETQILQRDRFAAVVTTLAILAGTLEQITTSFRLMMRGNCRELEEPRGKGQRGSSRMAYKKNPIISENIQGMARLLRADALCALEDISTWEFRSIEQSSVERHILSRSTSLTFYALERLQGLIDGLVVRPEMMLENLKATQDVWAANPVRDALMEAGVSYDAAYLHLQSMGFKAVDEERHLLELLTTEPVHDIPFGEQDDRTAKDFLGEERLRACFDYRLYIEDGINEMFKRAGLQPRPPLSGSL